MFLWSIGETLVFLTYASLITYLYEILDFTFLDVPWTPVALIGTAVAFMVGFQNNAAYDRIWEARKIWGGIVNTSRTWGMKVQEMVNNQYASSPLELEDIKEEKKVLIYRHIAWMTALRYAMRQRKSWETSHLSRSNRKWADLLHIPEKISSLEDNLMLYLSAEEEENNLIAQANIDIDKNGKITSKKVIAIRFQNGNTFDSFTYNLTKNEQTFFLEAKEALKNQRFVNINKKL